LAFKGNSMIAVTDIQKNLPDWPAGVIQPWLIEFANDPGMGWPPPEPFGDHRWGRLLGQRPVSWWRDVSWTLERTSCGLACVTPKAQADILGIRKEIASGKPSDVTRRRWSNIFRFLLNAGTFPVAPIVMRRPEGLSLIDGTHRFAVLSAMQVMPNENFISLGVKKPALEQEIWIGNHAKRELPLVQ
jgi:hypothetical protein